MNNANYSVSIDTGKMIPVTVTRFPSGEVNVKLEVSPGNTMQVHRAFTVSVQGYEPNTLFILACIKNALEDLLLRSNTKADIHLFMPYIPNARYDRHMVDGDSFGLQVFSDMLNILKFDRVLVSDPHSDVATSLIKNCVQIPQHVTVMNALAKSGEVYDVLVAPDAGAAKKIYKAAQALNKPVVTMSKSRDVLTGQIKGVYLLDELPDNAKCLIVDDICDGGRTFIEAAKVLLGEGATSVDLFVTHGIFSAGLDNLIDNGIRHVYTTDSFRAWDELNCPDLSVVKYFK